ncbi:RNA polymerase subunit sigma-70 [Megasphaera cerevisiae DSM 20462]|uniref:RNA polymerase subunit sigma-70 n=1 Tax=Megasphaera cerevisiae DSM 20462 TaxID=1122219 RepID=A0A0J6WT57_9FIRM|nr:sigma-70 family RNA polymerase sigma factor [Megasphaera cerevisiae]KMO86700.1 RNA polymerase subunit sigma-70 [Megasphaera cerevisiae DSM 20462]MCI1750595.1 sigma-70 family RNA polymerase sigma factor [Megasphaera cerevisiae]OKY53297.1 RNA polymerase subunit sigma-70 [Megasphaera cerevisiae]SJZ86336.1 RNA polymerase sporulation-specific sigma factor [Megasphaera cerevisiae DSM 20462]
MLETYLEELKHISLLKPEEEQALWIAYKDHGDLASRSRIIEQYQPLVFKEVMRWHIRKDMLPDTIQEGTLGLIEAVERFDYTRNIAFPLFAVHRIRGEIVDYLNKEGHVTSLSLDEPNENGLTLRELLPDEGVDIAEQTGQRLLFEHVAKVLERLPKNEQLVVEEVYLKDKQQKHIARDMDVSLPYVYRLQKRGIRRVRGMLSRFIHESKM